MDKICLSLIIDLINNSNTNNTNCITCSPSTIFDDSLVVQLLPALVEEDGELKHFNSIDDYNSWRIIYENKLNEEYGESLAMLQD